MNRRHHRAALRRVLRLAGGLALALLLMPGLQPGRLQAQPRIPYPGENRLQQGDELLTGEITDEQPGVETTLALETGQVVTITLERTGGDLDPFLLLLGPDGHELARNDDAPQLVGDTPQNAQILNFSAPAAGTYTIRATRFFQERGLTSGTFRLSITEGEHAPVMVTPVPPPAQTALADPPPPQITRAAVGDILTGTLDDALFSADYAIDLAAGEAISVTLERVSGDLDPYLTLRGPDGRELAFNDDAAVPVGGIPLNAQINGFRADADGTYVITATRYGEAEGVSSGSYRLTISGGQAALADISIQIGQAVEGTITDTQPVHEYSLALEGGQTVTITLEALDGELDPYLVLLDSRGQELIFNDDAAVQVGSSLYNAQIAGWAAPQSDVYTVRATRFLQVNGPTTGPFRLTITEGETVEGLMAPGSLTVGTTATGTITQNNYEVNYPITLAAGETIAVIMERTSGNLDALITISNEDGLIIAYNDDAVTQVGDDPYNSHITGFTAPTAGTYIIGATRVGFDGGTTTGAFTLSVEPGQPVSAADGGPLTIGTKTTGALTTTIFAVDYTLTLGPQEPVTITMEALDSTLDPTLIVYDAAGNELAYNDDALAEVGDSTYNAQIVGFVSLEGGTFTVRATHFMQEGGTSVGSFRLSVAAGSGEAAQLGTK